MEYTIKKGDCLSVIAKAYNTSVSAIQKANPQIKDVNKIVVGDRITIPLNSGMVDYEEIGKQFKQCLFDIQNLDSFKALKKVL